MRLTIALSSPDCTRFVRHPTEPRGVPMAPRATKKLEPYSEPRPPGSDPLRCFNGAGRPAATDQRHGGAEAPRKLKLAPQRLLVASRTACPSLRSRLRGVR